MAAAITAKDRCIRVIGRTNTARDLDEVLGYLESGLYEREAMVDGLQSIITGLTPDDAARTLLGGAPTRQIVQRSYNFGNGRKM